MFRIFVIILSVAGLLFVNYSTGDGAVSAAPAAQAVTYPIVDTGQTACYNNSSETTCPAVGASFYGQDAQFDGNQPGYTSNGNGTVTDNVTDLMWQQSADTDGDSDIDANDKLTYTEAVAYCQNLSLAGQIDWRLPDIKQLYSLIDFSGTDPSGYSGSDTSGLIPFIDTTAFDFGYGDTGAGERIIDAQYASSTKYVSTTMNGDETLFGVNFADGRIKGYGLTMFGSDKTFYVICTRGNTGYGVNSFTDNGDSTLTDNATGLMWAQNDSGMGLNWEEALAWVDTQNAANYLGHNDWRLPNGNILMIAWELKTEAEATAAGRNPGLLSEGELWPDHVIEVNPATGTIVWEWHVWDHLIQDYDNTQANYGVVADHPELIDLNFVMNGRANWNHINSIDYNAEFDQILLSVHNFSEIWIIDHSTTTAEATGHSGGHSGKGGDLIYRWGNPQAYGGGSAADQQLFVQHDAQWIPSGYPGEGNILVFNNGTGRSGGNYSSVDEIVPPVDDLGNYTLAIGSAYGPTAPTWSYTAATPTDLYAPNISGAQRLSNGNTLICDGPNGDFFEVTSQKETVWSYDYTGPVFRVTRYAADYPGLPVQ